MARSNMSSILLFFLILNSTHLRFRADGRAEPNNSPPFSKRGIDEEESLMRGQIGSRPPSCKRRCRSCGLCEAIQVPTDPQKFQTNLHASSDSAVLNLDYARGDDSSNYKPMSWKCRCGNSIFDP